MIAAKIIEDSLSGAGKRLTTFELSYPRCIHGEVMTHRVFSRNAMSSRAVPVAKMVDQVRENPFVPHVWGMNQAGMQSSTVASPSVALAAEWVWMEAAEDAAMAAEKLAKLGLHKQIVNRLLEPFQWMRTIVTATEFDNFFELRDHEMAEPHFQMLAKLMRFAMGESEPVLRGGDASDPYNWHLPYVLHWERQHTLESDDMLPLAKISAARCARVSYLTHDGASPSRDADLALYERLAGGVPIHASPLEHIGFPTTDPTQRCRNFVGWLQFRAFVEGDTP